MRSSIGDKGLMPKLLAGILLLCAITIFACAPKGKVCRIKPGRVCWEGIHGVAVLGFDGPYGEIVRSHVYDRLCQVLYFTPKDTTRIRALCKVSFGKLEEREFLKAIKDLEADAAITGHVTLDLCDIHGSDELEVKEGTGYYKKAKNAYGQWVDEEIKRTVIRAVPYVIRKASLTNVYKMFDLKAKGVISLEKLTEVYEEKFGGDKEYAPSSHRLSDLPASDRTVDELSARVATRLVAKLSRMKLARVVELDKGENRLVKQGVASAKGGQWEEAIKIWKEVIQDEPENHAAYYDLGVAHEGLGDMENLEIARDLYKRAASFSENKLYTDGIVRVDCAIMQGHNK